MIYALLDFLAVCAVVGLGLLAIFSGSTWLGVGLTLALLVPVLLLFALHKWLQLVNRSAADNQSSLYLGRLSPR